MARSSVLMKFEALMARLNGVPGKSTGMVKHARGYMLEWARKSSNVAGVIDAQKQATGQLECVGQPFQPLAKKSRVSPTKGRPRLPGGRLRSFILASVPENHRNEEESDEGDNEEEVQIGNLHFLWK
ncbi:hypothetical protein OIU84_011352 [Salix udensis]|uniref:Uncharacterized protein n=1 Tax=Salix udensis TaxID=889485 RepID=A0AAD6NX41_9ROSI|nr:hypothetical protein OIU84_011352 [Salix udensis]